MHRKTFAALAAVIALAACSNGAKQGAQATAPSAPLQNPIDFPLYPGAALISTHAFTQVIDAGSSPNGGSLFSNGNGTYEGHEIIASSAASFGELSAWVDRVEASPPPGYTAAESSGNPTAQAQRYGLNYAAFTRKADGRTHGVLLVVMDPHLVNQRFGVILGLISKYKALPAMMREPIDSEAKSRIGMTISEATQPDSAIGSALAALDEFEHKDSRGIVVLDAAKR